MILNKDQLLLDAEYWYPFTEFADLQEIARIGKKQGYWNIRISEIYDKWAVARENVGMLPGSDISWLALLIREAME